MLSDKPVLPFKQWMVRGVYATTNTPIREVVVSVPDGAVLMPHTCSIGDSLAAAKLCNSPGDPGSDTLGLIIAVMAERCLGSRSRWAAYMDFLPDAIIGMPIFWDKTELWALRNTSLAQKLAGKWQTPGCYVESPTQVEEQYNDIVLSFTNAQGVSGFPTDPSQQYQLYLWATAVVSAYSFTLGEDKYQAMVPLWDMLNHVTGQCNVRLHHSAKRGALQMIATKPIKVGKEIINNYGPLSDSELLRRFGFVEHELNPNNGCEIPFAMLGAICRESPVVLQETTSDAARRVSEEELLETKIHFMQKHELIPSDGWFKADLLGQPQCEMIEAVRILLLPLSDFKAFERQVTRWHCPLARPLSQLTSISHQVPQVIHTVASERLAALAEPTAVKQGAAQSLRQTAAQAVLITERHALQGLQLWIDKHDSTSLINCSKKVWMHIR